MRVSYIGEYYDDLDDVKRDWEWWLARTADGGWQLLTWGYR